MKNKLRQRLQIFVWTGLVVALFIGYSYSGPSVTGGPTASTLLVESYAIKIDNAATDGLNGTKNSLAYRVHEIEKHFHNSELWYGAAAGDTFLDPTSLTEWRVEAKDNGYTGTAIQLSNGDEIESGDPTKYYDLHEVLVTATSAANKIQKIQFKYGTGTVGTATVATEIAFFVPAAGKSTAVPLIMPRITCNNKLWVLAYSETNNATIDFVVGIHTYDG